LDSLRGWAASYVIIYHIALMPNPALRTPAWAAPVVLTDGTGVTLFFVASAFSLCLAQGGAKIATSLSRLTRSADFRIAPCSMPRWQPRSCATTGCSHFPEVLRQSPTAQHSLSTSGLGEKLVSSGSRGRSASRCRFYCFFPFPEARAGTVVTAAALELALLLVAALWPQAALLHREGFPQPVIDSQIQFA
jgi:hypothetical protein